jgi:hypothetical protein
MNYILQLKHIIDLPHVLKFSHQLMRLLLWSVSQINMKLLYFFKYLGLVGANTRHLAI